MVRYNSVCCLHASKTKCIFSAFQVDKFTIEAVDLGQVFKIRIRHDNSMMGADWYLDQVEVLDVETEEVYMFLCERWLSTKKEDKRIDRTFYVKVEEENHVYNLISYKCTLKLYPHLLTVQPKPKGAHIDAL